METATGIRSERIGWREGRKARWFYGLVVPLLPMFGWALFRATGFAGFLWMGPLWILVIIPILDWLGGTDTANPDEARYDALDGDRFYRWVTWAYLPLQYAGLVAATWVVATGHLGVAGLIGFALSVGMVGGIGINAAHEMGHKREELERWISRIALAQTFYGHFYVEHNRGHHSRVSTPEDPASSRFGESFWAFLPRTVVGGALSAWDLERGRLARNGQRTLGRHNKILQAWAMSAVLYAALVAGFGPRVVPFLAIQIVFGFSLLEVVNYIEHYGLLRQKLPTGRYERCMPRHSWNSSHRASNAALFNLERHSDHHANPTRRYQTLRHFDEAPQLPSGYGLMLGIAYVPPLWRRVMDHRVLELYGGDITLVNVHPRKRAKVLARYGAGGGSPAPGVAPAGGTAAA